MKKLIIILLFASMKAQGQQITVDSLASVIKTMQKQIADLQKLDTLTHTPAQFTVVTKNPKHKIISINNYASFLTAANANVTVLTTQLNAAVLRITALETALNALKVKLAGVRATTTITGNQ